MTAVTHAELVVRQVRANHQAKLDAEARSNLETYRATLLADLTPPADDCSARADILRAVAACITIGRAEDDYPAFNLSDEGKMILKAAIEAEILPKGEVIDLGCIKLFKDLSGVYAEHQTYHAAANSWSSARLYRKNQRTLANGV